MLIDLIPQFFDALAASNPADAYRRHYAEYERVLSAYWRNHIVDPDDPHADEIILQAVGAQRDDLRALLDRVDIRSVAVETMARCEEAYRMDRPVDVYLMVGVGGPSAGELVVDGRGVAFVCVEHFTGQAHPESHGMGLSPDLLPIWIAHEIAHAVRYTSPASRSELAALVADAGGAYDYWECGSRATLGELLINEGLAVAGARKVAPGLSDFHYFGYSGRQYRRVRQLEAFLRRTVAPEIEQNGLGFRLRYLAGGVGPAARLVSGKVLPERSGYYLGYRMSESYVARHGIAGALRAAAGECIEADREAMRAQSA